MTDPKPPTHEEAKAIVDKLCERAEYSPDVIERLTLAACIVAAGQTERTLRESAAENERLRETVRAREAEVLAACAESDELRAKLRGLTERRFPILGGRPPLPRSVPWSLLEANEARALDNHDQSLERLASRGGLGPAEMVAVLRDEKWSRRTFKTDEDATPELARILRELDENARLAAILREHGRTILEALAVAAEDDEVVLVEENASADMKAAAKALAEAIK